MPKYHFLALGTTVPILTIRIKHDTRSSKHCSTTASTKLDQREPLHLQAYKRKPNQVKEFGLCSSLTSYIVLVSAGTELIFILVVGIVLCFGFSVRIMLITL